MPENIFLDGQGSFNHSAKNAGTIKWGEFNNAAVNTGAIVLSAVFTGTAVNSGTIGDLMPVYATSVFKANSGNWESTYSTVQTNSASWGQGGGGSSDWDSITNKPTEFNPSAHTHSISEVAGLQSIATWVTDNSGNLVSDWNDITNKPTEFTPTTHTHNISEVSDLQPVVTWVTTNSGSVDTTLGNNAYSILNANSANWNTTNWDDITNKPTEFTPTTHTHHASSINAGVLDPARIPVINTSIQVISQGGLEHLTTEQQNTIIQGAIVTTIDGRRFLYVSGNKTIVPSYITLADVTPDWSVISSKPTEFNPSAHTHAISSITGLQSIATWVNTNSGNLVSNWSDIPDKPTEFNPSAHTHAISSVNGLEPAVTWVSNNSANPAIINYIFDNNQTAVSVNSKGSITLPSNFRITEWKILTDVATSTTVTLNKSTYDSYPSMTSLGSVTVTGARKNINSSPSFTNLSANDILEFVVSYNSAATKITVSLEGYKI